VFSRMLQEYLDAMGIDGAVRVLDMGCGARHRASGRLLRNRAGHRSQPLPRDGRAAART
jgi:hypothetical protein